MDQISTSTTRRIAVSLALMFLVLIGVREATCAGKTAQNTGKALTSVSKSGPADTLRGPSLAAQQVFVSVTSSVVSGPGPGTYTYTYEVTNAHNSTVGVELFGLRDVPPPDSATGPAQWTAFYGFDHEDSAVVWAVTDTITSAPAGWDSINVYPSPFEIQPAETKQFKLVSKRPPTPSILFYALGFDAIPEVGVYSVGGDGAPDYPTLWQAGVSGAAWGPDLRSVVGVDLYWTNDAPAIIKSPSPNPTSGAATIAFRLHAAGNVQLAVFDVQGRLVQTVINRQLPAGLHSGTWNGRVSFGAPAASGVYFLQLSIGGKRIGERKVVVIR